MRSRLLKLCAMSMKRHDLDYGRFYEFLYNDETLFAPSVTTFLKETEVRPFSRKTWKAILFRKGITPYDAELYVPAYAKWQDIEIAEAEEIVAEFINTSLPGGIADHFMPWKTKHSADRGNMFHDHAMKHLKPGIDFHMDLIPETDNEVLSNLVRSVKASGLLENVKRIVGIETSLYYVAPNGNRYAGSEDIAYETHDGKLVTADWKSKDKKHYSQLDYASENILQGVGYAGARSVRYGRKVDEVHIIYPFTDGSTAEVAIVDADAVKEQWKALKMRLSVWWETLSQLKPILNV
jgi:hypothetical protein